jgi:hypothetical protein
MLGLQETGDGFQDFRLVGQLGGFEVAQQNAHDNLADAAFDPVRMQEAGAVFRRFG